MTHNPIAGVSSRRHFTEMLKWDSTCLALTCGEQEVALSFQEKRAFPHKAPIFANVSKKGLVYKERKNARKKCQSRHEPWSSLTLHSFCALMSCGLTVNVTRYTATSCATLSDRLKPFRTLTVGKQNLHLYCVTLFLLTSAPSPGTLSHPIY